MPKYKTIALKTLGLIIIPRHEWLYPCVGNVLKEGFIRLDTRLYTTQSKVYEDIVNDIADRIESGETTKRVECAFVDGKTYVLDGHHTLAAYRTLGMRAPCVIYGKGPDQIKPPKLFVRK